MTSIKGMLNGSRVSREKVLERPPPIPCLGYEINTTEGRDYDCGYGAGFGCEDCIVNGGHLDPRVQEDEE